MRHAPLRLVTILIAAVSPVLVSACSPTPPPSIVLVVIDTVRADHLGAYGHERPTSPFLDELAERGARFERAFAPSPWTLPSIATILTGHYPHGHGAGRVSRDSETESPTTQRLGRRRFTGLAPGVRTLTQFLRNRGYATGAVINNLFLMPTFEVGRGFDVYDFRASRDSVIRRADESVDSALEWLDTVDDDRPAFLFLHLMDPHRRYDAPPPFRDSFSRPHSEPYGELPEARFAAEEADDRDYLAAAYDEEIAFVDQQLRRFVDELRSERPDAVVMITSDHGESFDEYLGHGKTLEDVQLRVPLLVDAPGIEPRVIDRAVSLVDVTPTLLESAGLEVPRRLDGISLWPALRGEELPDRVLEAGHLLYGEDRRAIIAWPYKLVVELETGERRLHDLARDPGETLDFASLPSAEHQEFLDHASPLLDNILARAQGRPVELDNETVRALRALGYIR